MAEYRPLVSVIMPVYNGQMYIAQAIESVFRDVYRPIEVIVVDDGSSDKTVQMIERFKDVRYIYQDNGGVASARNKGIAVSRGEIIAFLDCDDIWQPNRLTVTVGYFHQHPETEYALGKQLTFVESDCDVPQWMGSDCLVEPQDASGTGVLTVRREVFARVGMFNEEYRSGEDTEWLVRATELGIPMARLPEVFLHRRIHGGNLSIKTHRMYGATLMRIARESIRRQGGKKVAGEVLNRRTSDV